MIHGRIQVTVERGDFPATPGGDDDYNSACMAQIESKAIALATVSGSSAVNVEVEYPGERLPGSSWDKSGDALRVYVTDPVTVRTLSHEEWLFEGSD